MTESYVEAKIVLLGDTGVGKTSLVLRYVEQRFNPVSTPTIGASFLTKTIWVNENRVKLQIWDTAGQERFRSLAPMYYRGASAALLIYDVSSEDSFQKVKEWVKELRTNVFEDIILAIVGNQIDKPVPRKVDTAQALEYARSIGAHCFETSAKKNIGIEEMFLDIARLLVEGRSAQVTTSESSAEKTKLQQHQEKPSCCLS